MTTEAPTKLTEKEIAYSPLSTSTINIPITTVTKNDKSGATSVVVLVLPSVLSAVTLCLLVW